MKPSHRHLFNSILSEVQKRTLTKKQARSKARIQIRIDQDCELYFLMAQFESAWLAEETTPLQSDELDINLEDHPPGHHEENS